MNTKPDSEIAPTLPHSPEAERAILAAILLNHKSAPVLLARLDKGDFYLPQNQRIFEVLKSLAGAGKPTDELSAQEELLQKNELEAAGGIAYLYEITKDVPHTTGADYYATIVKDKALRRGIAIASDATYKHALSGSSTAEKVLDQGIEQLSALARDLEADKDSGTAYRDAALSLLQEFDSQGGVRIFTDIDELDRLTGGFRAGELVIFTAETGVGKTLLAQQTRRRACCDGRHTLFCSGEMRAEHLISRELATEAGIEHWKMRRPERITPGEMTALVEAASHECVRCRILDGELTLPRIRRVARQMKAKTGLDLVILDYDELIEAEGETEFDQQRNLVRGAKSLAMELSIPVIVISQLRKALQGEDRKRPTLQRLYGSGSKAKHSSIVVYVDREFVQELCGDETAARIVVCKNRDGKVGALDAYFNVKTLRFESAPKPQPAPGSVGMR
ncbi:MAG: DnaB-like helicase C-terminal domain-containing protein [Candidatus Acidiferrales bacterium]